MDEFELLGQWWLPDRPNHSCGGLLRFSTSAGLSLTLAGSLRLPGDASLNQIVIGSVPRVGPVTLIDCVLQRMKHGQSEYRVDLAFLGASIEERDDRRFRDLELRLSHLLPWLGISGITQLIPSGMTTGQFQEIRYVKPKHIQFSFRTGSPGADVSAVVRFAATETGRDYDQGLKESCSITFLAATPWTFAEWHHWVIAPFREFLTFAARTPNAIHDVTVRVPSRSGLELSSDGARRTPVKVSFNWTFTPSTEPLTRNSDMILPFSRMSGDRCGEVLSRWLALYEDLTPVIALLMAHYIYKHRFPSLPAEFLNLVQALESYHRRRNPEGKLPEDEFQAMRARILSSLSQDDKEWLEPRFEHANEKSLRHRLMELTTAAAITSPIWGSNSKRNTFIQRVVETRNFYTHYDQAAEQAGVSNLLLMDAIVILETLFEILLLLDLGFSPTDAHEMVHLDDRIDQVGKWKELAREP